MREDLLLKITAYSIGLLVMSFLLSVPGIFLETERAHNGAFRYVMTLRDWSSTAFYGWGILSFFASLLVSEHVYNLVSRAGRLGDKCETLIVHVTTLGGNSMSRSMKVPVRGAKRRLAFAVLLSVWFMKLIFGLIGATWQHAPSFPDAVRGFPYPHMSDMEFYVVMPALFVALNLIMLVFAKKIPKWLAIIAAVLQVFLLLVLLFLGAGGI